MQRASAFLKWSKMFHFTTMQPPTTAFCVQNTHIVRMILQTVGKWFNLLRKLSVTIFMQVIVCRLSIFCPFLSRLTLPEVKQDLPVTVKTASQK